MQQKYEVIRLIEQGTGCHIVMDYVEGEGLVPYLKAHPNIEKKQLFLWMRQIVKQLDSIQKVKGVTGYGYVTPYCMIVKEDKSIAFLDLKAESNAFVLKMMEKQIIQKAFFQLEEREDDYYSLGKTIQYIFAHVTVEPALTKREEHRFLKIISKCLSKHFKQYYSEISDILKDFPKRRKKKKFKRKTASVLVVIVIFFAILGGSFIFGEQVTKNETEPDYRLFFDMGLTYFADLEDYQRSKDFFEKSRPGTELGAEYAELAEFMSGKDQTSEEETEQLLELIEGVIETENQEDSRYIRSLLKVYMRLDSETARKKMVKLGEKLLHGNAFEVEMRELLASVYTKNAEYEKAIEEYQILCQWDINELYYKSLIELYDKTEQKEKALETCRKFIEKVPDSKEISIIFLRLQCKNTSIEKEVLEKEIQNVVERLPDLPEEPEFQKLQTEYGIKMEGDNIWVEK